MALLQHFPPAQSARSCQNTVEGIAAPSSLRAKNCSQGRKCLHVCSYGLCKELPSLSVRNHSLHATPLHHARSCRTRPPAHSKSTRATGMPACCSAASCDFAAKPCLRVAQGTASPWWHGTQCVFLCNVRGARKACLCAIFDTAQGRGPNVPCLIPFCTLCVRNCKTQSDACIFGPADSKELPGHSAGNSACMVVRHARGCQARLACLRTLQAAARHICMSLLCTPQGAARHICALQ